MVVCLCGLLGAGPVTCQHSTDLLLTWCLQLWLAFVACFRVRPVTCQHSLLFTCACSYACCLSSWLAFVLFSEPAQVCCLLCARSCGLPLWLALLSGLSRACAVVQFAQCLRLWLASVACFSAGSSCVPAQVCCLLCACSCCWPLWRALVLGFYGTRRLVLALGLSRACAVCCLLHACSYGLPLWLALVRSSSVCQRRFAACFALAAAASLCGLLWCWAFRVPAQFCSSLGASSYGLPSGLASALGPPVRLHKFAACLVLAVVACLCGLVGAGPVK